MKAKQYMMSLDSSWLDDLIYNRKTHELRLTTKSGWKMYYQNVEETEVQNLILAKSAGEYYNEHIRYYYDFELIAA